MKRENLAVLPTLVVVAPWVFHLRCGIGGGVLCFRMLKALSAHYELHWVSFDVTSNDVEAGKLALGDFCASVTTVPLAEAQPLWRARARQILGGAPVAAQRMWSPVMASTVEQVVKRSGAAAVLFQFPQVAQYLIAAAGVPTIMDTQDVCMVSMYRQWRKTTGFMRRLAKASNWFSWTRYEMRHYAQADLLLALSDTDAGVLRAFMPDVPCVMSPVATEVPARVARGPGTYVAMVGNFHHPPNVDGLRWLLDDIWPRVRAQVPNAQLRVAGPECPVPDAALEARGVRMVGFVDDIDVFFDEAAVSLGPYRFGGGVKIKVLEALARGCPVVATSVGAEGLEIVDGDHFGLATDSESFAAAIVQLLKDPVLAARRGQAGRVHVERHFSYQGKTAGLKQAFDAVIARRSSQAAPRHLDAQTQVRP
jgi:glycosyltransferase involved in cell wall biosynthesis